ncbi:hypothetical protein AB0M29_05360 [Streptomyces sp. NPDC051976]|uniref:ATP-grasp domain-containing protein n=1 Tax=Streptomyces sp. NPDC051976 TaxID=3154947 RepID=UPI00342A1EF9
MGATEVSLISTSDANEPFRPDFVAHMERAAALSGAELRWHSGQWVAELRHGGRRRLVVGYHFPLNDAASALIATDKVAASVLLTSDGVPNVPHRLLRPRPDRRAAETAAGVPLPLVIKPLSASGGRDVHRASTRLELTDVLASLTTRYTALAVCPWVPIGHEYRVVVLDDRLELAFEKRPADRAAKEPGSMGSTSEWRHNLKFGATAVLLTDPDLCGALGDLAGRAMRSLGLVFGSVDIVATDGGDLTVIEVNSGVCLERFSRQSQECHAAAERVYAAAVAACVS